MTTTSTFNHIDLSSQAAGTKKPWTKVDAGGMSYGHEKVTRTVHNLRNESPSEFNTDISGFGTFVWPSLETEFLDDARVRGQYYDDTAALLRANCEALASNLSTGPDGGINHVRKVVIFDHTIRRRVPGAARAPVQQVHVDQTAAAAEARVRRHLPADEQEDLLKTRFQLINVWRPIAHAATDHPLAVIDWRSTRREDFVPVDLLYPKRKDSVMGSDAESSSSEDLNDDRGKEKPAPKGADPRSTEGYEARGETMGVAASERHRFYYVKDMQPEEVLLLKCYDSWGEGEKDSRAGLAVRTPHTAFEDPDTPEDAKPRESIEVRALVFYEK
ncbi:methyltransferase [Nemania sp. FL0916]|nr:methyltransferase [Nemania sp. FL0916]